MRENARVVAAARERPIRLVVGDGNLARNRLTVLLRLLLALPHLVWLALWGVAVFVVAVVLWLAVVVNGTPPTGLHDFVAGYLRYATHVGAYLYLAADAYPSFRGRPGYAVDLEIDPPRRQSRWSAFFRLLLALPALALAAVLGGGLASGSSGTSWRAASGEYGAGGGAVTLLGVAAVAALLLWFVALARGRAARGLRDLVAYALGYAAQAAGYLLLLTDRYPTSDPALAEAFSELPEHPIRIAVEDDLRRSRLTILFRLLLALPHVVWLVLWTLAVAVAAVATWVVALVTGRTPAWARRFFAAYVRYHAHVNGFVYLVGRRFPGFTGRAGSYEVDLEIDTTGQQSRWTVLLRLLLALPALLLTAALSGVLLVIGVLAWFYGLATGRMPSGLRDLGAVCIRYAGQTYAYLLVLTDRYPYAAPVLRSREPERAATATAEALS